MPEPSPMPTPSPEPRPPLPVAARETIGARLHRGGELLAQGREIARTRIDGAKVRARNAYDGLSPAAKARVDKIREVLSKGQDISAVVIAAVADPDVRARVMEETGDLLSDGFDRAGTVAGEVRRNVSKGARELGHASAEIARKAATTAEAIAVPAAIKAGEIVRAHKVAAAYTAGVVTGVGGLKVAEAIDLPGLASRTITIGTPIVIQTGESAVQVGQRVAAHLGQEIANAATSPMVSRPDANPAINPAVNPALQPGLDPNLVNRLSPLTPNIDPAVVARLADLAGAYGPPIIVTAAGAAAAYGVYRGVRYAGARWGPDVQRAMYSAGTALGERVTPIAEGITQGVEDISTGITRTKEELAALKARAGETAHDKLYQFGTAVGERARYLGESAQTAADALTAEYRRAKDRMDRLPRDMAAAINTQVDNLSRWVHFQGTMMEAAILNTIGPLEGGAGSTIEGVGQVLVDFGHALQIDASVKRERAAALTQTAAALRG